MRIILNLLFCLTSFGHITYAADDHTQCSPQRLLGHRRLPTELMKDLVDAQDELAAAGLSAVEKKIEETIKEMRRVRSDLKQIKDEDLTWKHLYPYDTSLQQITVCHMALMKLYQGYSELSGKLKKHDEPGHSLAAELQSIIDLSILVKERTTQFMDLIRDHQARMFNIFFMNPKNNIGNKGSNLDYMKCRQLWLQHDRRAISVMFDGITDFDDVMRRLLSSEINRFVPLVQEKANSPHQGWKLHVSATPETAFKVAKVILPELASLNVEHKIAGSIKFLKRLQADKLQKGKFITIYPRGNDEAVRIAKILDRLLRDNDFTENDFDRVPGDAQLGHTGGLSTRYGCFKGLMLFVLDDNGNQIIENGVELFVRDQRDGPYKPGFIKSHPFGDLLVDPAESLSLAKKLSRKDGQRNLTS